jgi:hypothetical protein
MRALIVLVGVLLTEAVLAAECNRPSAPDVPTDVPIGARAEKKLSRAVARYVEASAKYVGCMRADASADPFTVAQRETAALRDVANLIELYETRVGHSDNLIAEMSEIGGPTSRATLDRRIAAAQRALESDAIATLNLAIADINAGRYGQARAAIGELDFERLTPFERSKAERVLYTVAYGEEKFVEAREHIQRSIAAGGLSRQELFNARLALVNVDVMLRLRDTAPQVVADQPVE